MAEDTKVSAIVVALIGAAATIAAAVIIAPSEPVPQVTETEPLRPIGLPSARTERLLSSAEADVIASDALKRHDSRRTEHLPFHALDGDLGTSWQVREPKEEYLEVRLKEYKYLHRIKLTSGLLSSPGSFERNSHIRNVTLSVDDERVRAQDVAEDERWIIFDSINRKARVVRLAIDAVWQGKQWNDLAISEIELYISDVTP